ncbi:MAG: bifunctional adenosylcobinamide kinase/adenosylcobinamide-phosphate guanylyltransferase [Dehalococcoidia bacterium]|jgi:adenosyl cobinamide kinase/adenosyl cobinamide phosphate guanylyltransferase|nr:bifunctional adenosylcobinamide kinase/adenosylcobinamide-phosphate guanylyltransferase [Dehalococcoidia bacterium]
MGDLWFIIGGARSGKSRHAEQLARDSGRAVVYVATMEPRDDESRRRVARHRASRPAEWTTVEAPLDPAAAVRASNEGACVLLDCLSLWVANRLMALGEPPVLEATEATGATEATEALGQLDTLESTLRAEAEALAEAAASRSAPTVVVSNEVGAGVVPEYPLGRTYRDLLGVVNQTVAVRATRAWLMVAGRPLELPPAER